MAMARLLKLTDRTAAELLRLLMSELSQEHYCAGWLTDLEHHLWEIAKAPKGRGKFGFGEVERKWRLALHQLADYSQGWWIHTGGGGEKFVALAECKRIHQAWKKRQKS